jgi:hypothetical protein
LSSEYLQEFSMMHEKKPEVSRGTVPLNAIAAFETPLMETIYCIKNVVSFRCAEVLLLIIFVLTSQSHEGSVCGEDLICI